MRFLLPLLLTHLVTALFSQNIQISLYDNKDINALTISVQDGRYRLKAKGETFGEYKRDIFYITRHGGRMDVTDKKNFIGDFEEISIRPVQEGILTLKPINPDLKSREVNDEIILKVIDNKIRVINKVDMERYIAGVIEAECGPNATFEFYKAQAVLIRTYTIKNMFKHGEEGFNLCDQVHCQVFHGRSLLNDNIYRATKETTGQVLIDSDSVLILSPFFSNCGGHTSSSGMVWQKDLPYLIPIEDPFCNTGKKFSWTATISLSTWKNFLREKGVPEAIISDTKYNYRAAERKKYLKLGTTSIAFREIREQFKLNSTFFSFHVKGNQIIFKGNGYGHGAGMCQEGAMEMSRVGYTYLDIIHFYFRNISISDYREMDIARY